MERRFRITVDGRPYVVTVEELGEGPGVAPAEPTPGVAHPAPTPGAQPAYPAAGPDDVASTLSGVVEAIVVGIGQEIRAGDRVATIEAMKMKTPVVAHRGGRVARIHVRVGETVAAGRPIVTLA